MPPAALPFTDSLCHRCSHLRLVHSGRGSVFLMCEHPELPKYMPQPIRGCPGFVPSADPVDPVEAGGRE